MCAIVRKRSAWCQTEQRAELQTKYSTRGALKSLVSKEGGRAFSTFVIVTCPRAVLFYYVPPEYFVHVTQT